MPYKRVGKRVLVEKHGRWQTVPGGQHDSEAKAQAHLTALNIRVHDKEDPMKPPKKKKGY